MKTLTLFDGIELEKLADKFGFIYEPDKSKCKYGCKINVMFITFYVNDGIVSYGEPGFAATTNIIDDWILKYISYKYVNRVYVDIFDQEDQNKLNHWNKNYHGHIWVKICGHTAL